MPKRTVPTIEYDADEMRGLSVHQPYARFIANGEKLLEVRTWRVSWRGTLAICSTKAPYFNDLPCGYIVALTHLVRIRPMRKDANDEHWSMTEWQSGLYVWRLAYAEPVWPPVAITGRLGLYRIPARLAELAVDRLHKDFQDRQWPIR